WIDGDCLHIGGIAIGSGAMVGARSHLAPGATVGKNSDIAPGSAVLGRVPPGEFWSGSPANRRSRVKHPWPLERPGPKTRWATMYALSSVALSLFPVVAGISALLIAGWIVGTATSWGELVGRAALAAPAAAVVAFAVLALLTLIAVRVLGCFIKPGTYPVHST